MRYPDRLGVREARERYFAEAGLSEAGYAARWVRLQAGPVPIVFPNTAGRVRAVKLHDLHHVATDYQTTWTGEAEIAAWELAGGCGRHWAAWSLNLWALAIGAVVAPQRTFRAFARGRRSRTLYDGEFRDELLDLDVAALRRKLRLDQPAPSATAADAAAFAGVLLLGVANAALSLLPPVAIAWWLFG